MQLFISDRPVRYQINIGGCFKKLQRILLIDNDQVSMVIKTLLKSQCANKSVEICFIKTEIYIYIYFYAIIHHCGIAFFKGIAISFQTPRLTIFFKIKSVPEVTDAFIYSKNHNAKIGFKMTNAFFICHKVIKILQSMMKLKSFC